MNIVQKPKLMIVLNSQVSQKITDGKDVGLLPTLTEVAQLKSNSTVAFAVAKNIKVLSSALDTKNKAREAILIAHASKNEDGTPSIAEGQYQFADDTDKHACISQLADLENLDSGAQLHHITEADAMSIQGITAHQILSLGDLLIDTPIASTQLEVV